MFFVFSEYQLTWEFDVFVRKLQLCQYLESLESIYIYSNIVSFEGHDVDNVERPIRVVEMLCNWNYELRFLSIFKKCPHNTSAFCLYCIQVVATLIQETSWTKYKPTVDGSFRTFHSYNQNETNNLCPVVFAVFDRDCELSFDFEVSRTKCWILTHTFSNLW